MNLPGIIASNPGSTVTIANKDDLLNGIVQGISSQVVQGISITQSDATKPTPSLSVQLDAVPDKDFGPDKDAGDQSEKPDLVGSIEQHEPEAQLNKKPEIAAEISEVKPEESTEKPVEILPKPEMEVTEAPVVVS